MDLSGKLVVVTGGSKGIGEELVKQSRAAGADVVFTYRSGHQAALKLALDTGAQAIYPLSLGDSQSTSEFFESLRRSEALQARTIDYFIANAGMEFSGGLEKHTLPEMDDVVRTNLVGNMYLLQKLVTKGLMSQGGQISVIGSIAADGNHDQFAYSAAKAGLRGAVESLARYDGDVKNQGLGVKLLEPAFVRTPMTERILKLIERRVIRAKGGDALVKEFSDSKSVMDAPYAAEQILALTVDPSVTGIRAIPEGANLHTLRAKYF